MTRSERTYSQRDRAIMSQFEDGPEPHIGGDGYLGNRERHLEFELAAAKAQAAEAELLAAQVREVTAMLADIAAVLGAGEDETALEAAERIMHQIAVMRADLHRARMQAALEQKNQP